MEIIITVSNEVLRLKALEMAEKTWGLSNTGNDLAAYAEKLFNYLKGSPHAREEKSDPDPTWMKRIDPDK